MAILIKKPILCGVFLFVAIGMTLLTSRSVAKNIIQKPNAQDESRKLPNPDALLIEVYKSLATNNLQNAQLKIDELTEAYPHFQLGHLIRGDLLLMHTQAVTSFGSAQNASTERLKDFRAEASARLKAIREKPDSDLIPSSILQLRDDQKQVLLVDARRSRLYLYENTGDMPRLVTDYYISQGKLGINKLKEGDQRTPVGVYYITSRLAGTKLPDFYGPGALPINYPNDWDKINGRSGSGIWLHGVPSETFSRPPLASDGCIVLANPDFLSLAETIDIGKTPVIISENIEFVNRKKWTTDKQVAIKLIEDWRTDLESMNVNRLLANYSRNFKTLQGDDINTWFSKQRQLFDGIHDISIKLRDITQFRYPGKDELIVSTFTQDTITGKYKTSIKKRQYWIKEASRWRIIYEAQV
ncbi:MAG: L,D-transpeptidase family protein [Undibacterium sp.]|nr:L,D-transpeptidase family protein [Undibacterium sp.]